MIGVDERSKPGGLASTLGVIRILSSLKLTFGTVIGGMPGGTHR